MGYVTLTELKAYLLIDEIVDDGLLTSFIAAAQSITERETGRVFEAVSATKYFTQENIDGRVLYLDRLDLVSVTTLTNGNGVEITSDQFRLEPLNSSPKFYIRLIDNDVSWEFDDEYSTIAVTGPWGYSTSPPEDIKWANNRLAGVLYKQKDTSIDMDRPIVTGEGATILPAKLPADVMDVFKKYRRGF